jgi:hypothetical protein
MFGKINDTYKLMLSKKLSLLDDNEYNSCLAAVPPLYVIHTIPFFFVTKVLYFISGNYQETPDLK